MQTFRWRAPSSLLFLILMTAGAAGCSDDPVPQGRLELDPAVRTSSGIEERTRVVIRDQKAWEAMWTQIVAGTGKSTSAPSIDFDVNVAIVAARGRSPSSGYGISIAGVERLDETATITVYEVDPGDSCIELPAFVTPIDVYVAPRFTGEAIFLEQKTVDNC